jgi:hypothetical protein
MLRAIDEKSEEFINILRSHSSRETLNKIKNSVRNEKNKRDRDLASRGEIEKTGSTKLNFRNRNDLYVRSLRPVSPFSKPCEF